MKVNFERLTPDIASIPDWDLAASFLSSFLAFVSVPDLRLERPNSYIRRLTLKSHSQSPPLRILLDTYCTNTNALKYSIKVFLLKASTSELCMIMYVRTCPNTRMEGEIREAGNMFFHRLPIYRAKFLLYQHGRKGRVPASFHQIKTLVQFFRFFHKLRVYSFCVCLWF